MNLNPTRVTSTLGAGAVAGIAAWSSWSHMVGVALHVGERPEVAYLLPLSVDGLLIVASAAMVDDKRNGRTPRWSARVAFAVGVAASLGANVAHAQPTWGARAVAAWPALALLLVVELLSRRGRTVAVPATVPDATAARAASDGATVAPGVTPPATARARRTPRGKSPTAARVAAAAAAAPGAPVTALAARAGVSESTARRHLAAAATAPTPAAVAANGHGPAR